jgi:hypothetical protein
MQRNYKGKLILNWKTGGIRVLKERKQKPRLKPFEVPISFDINLIMPEQKESQIKGDITIPEPVVGQMVLDSL